MEQLEQTLAAIAAADTPDLVEAIRVSALGKQGWVSALLKTLGAMTPDQRQSEGPKIHAARESVTAALAERKASLEAAALDARLAAETVDLSLPASEALRGSVHPISQVMDELAELFAVPPDRLMIGKVRVTSMVAIWLSKVTTRGVEVIWAS